jgi:DNA-binding Lrp family transcriptional regulator
MNNRLYCTFVKSDEVKEISEKIQYSYRVLFDKIFVLESLDGDKIMLTYNVDLGNSNVEFAIGNTILVHRKKQTNTLYTINALNELIKSLNNGVLDKSYSINWNDYKNCILLVQADGYKKIDTKIKEIINLS